MSVTFSTVVRPVVARRANTFSRLFSGSLNAIVRYFVCRDAIATLSELDDRALGDIGIARCQIEPAVRGFITNPDRARL